MSRMFLLISYHSIFHFNYDFLGKSLRSLQMTILLLSGNTASEWVRAGGGVGGMRKWRWRLEVAGGINTRFLSHPPALYRGFPLYYYYYVGAITMIACNVRRHCTGGY